MRRIILWRHGRTTWNAEHRFQGQTDIPLDELGLRQAARAAQELALLAPTAIVSSDLQRAHVTAMHLGDFLDMPVSIDAGLRETHAGEWEGLTRPELEARFGEQWKQWVADPHLRPGGGETRVEVADRVVAAVERALAEQPDDATIVFATHGGAARAGIGRLLGLPPDQWSVLGVLGNCAWSVLAENTTGHGAPWRLHEYNATSLPVHDPSGVH